MTTTEATVFPSAAARSARRACAGFALAALLLTGVPLAQAETRCVHNVGELYSFFNEAVNAPEGTSWYIHIRQGTYTLSQSLDLATNDYDNKEFYVSGGWTGTDASDTSCYKQTLDASLTAIKGEVETANDPGIGYFIYGDNKRFDFQWLRFQDFSSLSVQDHACMSPAICPDTDAIVFEHVEFDHGSSINIDADDAARVVFRNNLVSHMHPITPFDNTIFNAPVGIVLDNEGSADISFNTFATITCEGTPGGVMIESHISDVTLHHNIFQTTGCSDDLYVDPAGGHSITPISNLYSGMGGSIAGNLADNGNVQNFNPLFVSTAIPGDYHLQVGSPAVNAGQTPVGALLLGLIPPPVDADGKPRLVGTRYDIGAYESAVNDGAPPTIKVTNTNDAGAGSLRAAIDQANNQVGTAQKIVFDIAASCPQVIPLDSALPDVTDSLVIDGYSQPGASENDLDAGNDATVCIAIAPGASGISHAIEVPVGAPDSTTLTVKGIAFGSSFYAFSDAAIELRAGTGHFVSGNFFGGLGPGDLGPLGTTTRAVLITGTATDVTVGGDDPASRNTIGGMFQNAIVINGAGTSGHVISNNYIGLTPNGLSAQPNAADGISATGGTDVIIKNNAIAASDRGITISGTGTTGFTVTGNRIGTSAYGVGLAEHANNVGIQIQGASGQHTIGAPPLQNLPSGPFSPGGFANDIRNNLGPGIYLGGTGAFVSIRGNRIEQNGDAGIGLGIDLGALGQLGNDDGDGDAGTNNLQNYPIVKGVAPTGVAPSGVIVTVKSVLNTKPNEALRVDLYRSPTCPQGSTGANATTYLRSVDVNSGATGIVDFAASVLVPGGTPGYLTATATTSTGNTSELAPCVSEDTIFVDGQEKAGL